MCSLGGCIAAAPLLAPAISGVLSAGKATQKQAAKDAKKKSALTQLQTRQLQTRTYDTTDTKKILQVALAVLQDDGFVVQNANVEVGLLSATKSLHETHVDDAGTAFAKGFFGVGFSIPSEKFSTVEANITVTPHGQQARVRFSARLSSVGYGATGADTTYEAITESDFYQSFFAKLEKGIFIQQEEI